MKSYLGKALYLTILWFEEEMTVSQHRDAKYFLRLEGTLKRLLNSFFFIHSFFVRDFVTFLNKRTPLEYNLTVTHTIVTDYFRKNSQNKGY